MFLRTLFLKDFRLFTETKIEFSPRINVIYGPNARGKTTVLEAIHLLITGRSFRTAQIRDLIRKGASCFYVEAVFFKHGIEQSLKFAYNGTEKKILHNQTPCRSISTLLGLIQGTALIPEDIALIKGSPRNRRSCLDVQLAQIDPLYVHYLMRYHRAMRQRNHLLRTKNISTMETWEHEMAKAATYLIQQRNQLIQELQTLCQPVINTLSDAQEQLSLVYKSCAKKQDKELFSHCIKQYGRLRSREMQLGMTLFGPHRDDLQILVGNQEARYFASAGQQHSCVAALRFAEWKRLNELADEHPLMLIDDMGASLDADRRKKMYSFLESLQQVFLTTTEKPIFQQYPLQTISL